MQDMCEDVQSVDCMIVQPERFLPAPSSLLIRNPTLSLVNGTFSLTRILCYLSETLDLPSSTFHIVPDSRSMSFYKPLLTIFGWPVESRSEERLLLLEKLRGSYAACRRLSQLVNCCCPW